MADDFPLRERLLELCRPRLKQCLVESFGPVDAADCAKVAENVLAFDYLNPDALNRFGTSGASTWLETRWSTVAGEIVSSRPVQDCLKVLRARRGGVGSQEFEALRAWCLETWCTQSATEDEGPGISRATRMISLQLQAVSSGTTLSDQRSSCSLEEIVELVCARVFRPAAYTELILRSIRGEHAEGRLSAWVDLQENSDPSDATSMGDNPSRDYLDATLSDYEPTKGGYFHSYVDERLRLKASDVTRTYGVPKEFLALDDSRRPTGAGDAKEDSPETWNGPRFGPSLVREGDLPVPELLDSVAERVDRVRQACREGQFTPREVAVFDLIMAAYVDPDTYARPTRELVPTLRERRLLERWIREVYQGGETLAEQEIADLSAILFRLKAMAPTDRISRILGALLEDPVRTALLEASESDPLPDSLRREFLEELRRIIGEVDGWEDTLSRAEQSSMEDDPDGDRSSMHGDRVELRRRLLASRYPEAFVLVPRRTEAWRTRTASPEPPNFRKPLLRELERIKLTLATADSSEAARAEAPCVRTLAGRLLDGKGAPGAEPLNERLRTRLPESLRKALQHRDTAAQPSSSLLRQLEAEWARISRIEPWVTASELARWGAPRILIRLARLADDPVLERRGWRRFVAWAWPGVLPQPPREEERLAEWDHLDHQGIENSFETHQQEARTALAEAPLPDSEGSEGRPWKTLVRLAGGCRARPLLEVLRQHYEDRRAEIQNTLWQLDEQRRIRGRRLDTLERTAERLGVSRVDLDKARRWAHQLIFEAKPLTEAEALRYKEVKQRLEADAKATTGAPLDRRTRRAFEFERFTLGQRQAPIEACEQERIALKRYLDDTHSNQPDACLLPPATRSAMEKRVIELAIQHEALRLYEAEKKAEQAQAPDSDFYRYLHFKKPWIREYSDLVAWLGVSQPTISRAAQKTVGQARGEA